MIGLGILPLLLLVGVAVGVTLWLRNRPHPSPDQVTTAPGLGSDVRASHPTAHRPRRDRPRDGRIATTDRIATDLDRWVAAGLIDAAHADAITAFERSARLAAPTPTRPAPITAAARPEHPRRRIPVVAEGLGYIGGILGTVGVTLLVQRSWADIGQASHLAIAAAATVVLVVAGWLVHEQRDPALARLRWTLWLAATATAAVFGWVLGHEVLEVESGELEALTIAGVVAVLAMALWWNRPRPLQQVVALGATLVAFGTMLAEIVGTGGAGLVVWVAGALMLLSGIGLVTSIPALTVGVGAAGTMFGALMLAPDHEALGLPFACLTAAGLLALAVTRRPVARENQRVVLTVFGIIALVQSAPQTIAWFARDAGVATGAVVWTIGLVTVATAIRRRVHGAIALEVLGGLVMLGGAAVTGVQSESVATLAGIATAIGFVALGTVPGRVLMSVTGSVGLLVFVPWSIAHFFPGEGRAPLLILVAGAVLVAVAVLLTRQGKRFRTELGEIEPTGTDQQVGRMGSEGGRVDVDAEEHPAERLVQPR